MRRTRSLAAIMGVLFALVGTGLTPATAEEPTAASAPAPQQVARTGIWIGTHNIQQQNGDPVGFADVIGWQEVSSSKQDSDSNAAVRKRLRKRLPGYAHWFPKGAGAKAHPISWKTKRFALVKNSKGKKMRGSVRAHEGVGGQTPARWVNWVLLRDRTTKQRFVVVNTHMINGAWNGNHPENEDFWFQHRRVLRNRINAVQKFKAPIFVVGDFNKKQGPVKLAGVRRIPMRNASKPYDHIYAEPRTHATQVVTKRVLMGKRHGSDHHALRTHVVIKRS
ncbi:MAG: hypothetical protein ACTH2Q_16990 [Propionibacteriaceae bacterium]